MSKERGRIGIVLKRLFNTILLDNLNYNKENIFIVVNNKIIDYLNDKRNFTQERFPIHQKEKIVARSNLKKELLENEEMTFKVFIKGLKVLGLKKVRFSVEVTHPDNHVSSHGVTLDLQQYSGQDIDHEIEKGDNE